MGRMKKFSETIGWILAIAVLFYLPTDWIQPYVLPLTFLGIILILGYAFYTLKNRGLLVLAGVIVFGLMSAPALAASVKIKECGGSYKRGNTIGSVVQDGVLDGNIFTSDFDDEKVLQCVQENIATLRGPVCSAPIKEDTYDNEVRDHSFYIMENFRRMSATDVHDSWFGYFTDKLGLSESDIAETYSCAKKYVDNAAKVDKKMEASCRTIGQTVQKGAEECWPCSLVGMFVESVQTLAGNMYPYVKTTALYVLGMVFMFWIAFRVLKFIATLGYGDPGEFMTDLLIRFITVCIAAALLHAPIVDFYRIAISPFINMTAALSGKLTEMAITDGQTTFAEQAQQKLGIKMTESCKSCALMNDPDYEFPNNEGSVVVMDAQSVNGLLCMTCRAYNQVMPMIAIGEKMNCYAMITGYNIPFTPIVIPNFPYLYIGVGLVIMFSILAVLIAFYMLDAILRLGFVIVLTPLYIAAWAFPISREYSTKAWHMILFSLLQFIGVAVMMALFMNICFTMIPGDTTSLINYMVNDNVEGVYKVITGMEPLPPLAGIAGGAVAGAVAGAAIAGSSVALVAAGTMTFVLIFVIVGFVFFAFKMLTASEKVVEALSGIAMGIPSISLGALTSMVQEGMQFAGMASNVAGKGGKNLGDKIKDKKKSQGGGDSSQGAKSASKSKFESKTDTLGLSKNLAGGQTTSKIGKGVDGGGKEGQGQAMSGGIEKAGNIAGNAVEKGGNIVGRGMKDAGFATTKKGGELMSKGGEMSETGVGALMGVPKMVAGAAVVATGMAMTATGHVTQAASKVAGAAIKYGSKMAGKGANGAANGAKAAGNAVASASKTVANKVASKVVGKKAEGVVGANPKSAGSSDKKTKSPKQKYRK